MHAGKYLDEILYHSRIHPEQRSNTLSQERIAALHRNISYVCQSAVSVNADSDKFPDNWLFNHRWVREQLIASQYLVPDT